MLVLVTVILLATFAEATTFVTLEFGKAVVGLYLFIVIVYSYP